MVHVVDEDYRVLGYLVGNDMRRWLAGTLNAAQPQARYGAMLWVRRSPALHVMIRRCEVETFMELEGGRSFVPSFGLLQDVRRRQVELVRRRAITGAGGPRAVQL